jgi:succinyl-diaminopimelate desuccinylase
MSIDPIQLTQDLIRCPSVTPVEAGALTLLENHLTKLGFTCHRLKFSEVDNLYARIGTESPHLCYLGHTDVVPVGDLSSWKYPPFDAVIDDGKIYGRGASDMKGGIACFLAAVSKLFKNKSINGSLSFLITGDEEGPSINGTKKVVEWLEQRGETIDVALIGEPSNPTRIGEMIKIGRRGSLSGSLTIIGKQGHVAYPDLAQNPVTILTNILHDLKQCSLDQGTEEFDPSNLEITSLDTDNQATNVIPETTSAKFNIRYNSLHTADTLKNKITEIIERYHTNYDLIWQHSGDSFISKNCPITHELQQAIYDVTGLQPELSTTGGTSDARFIHHLCPIMEFGLTNQTIHMVDEHVAIDDLNTLTNIYENFLLRACFN